MNQQQALIALMQSKYSEIRDLETQYQIMGRDGDYRPRIEYYHDAVRALGGDYDDGLSKDSRLSVERLAYDVEMLRLITSRPTVAGRGEQHYSTSDAVVMDGVQGSELRPDRPTKQKLGSLYKDYTVFFVALLAEKADHNNEVRNEEMDMLIEDLHRLENLLIHLAQGNVEVHDVVKAANLIEHDGLRQQILQLLNYGKPNKADLDDATNTIRSTRDHIKTEQQSLDAAGMRFAGGQLAVYEESKTIVQELAGQGLNIAGKFTASAMQQQTGQGRGM